MLRSRETRLILVIILAMLSSACGRTEQTPVPTQAGVTVPPVEQVLEPTTTAAKENILVSNNINAIAGGEVRLLTHAGDSVQLFIPPFALAEDTEISMIAYSEPLGSPFKNNFFPGITLEPAGLSLRLPATITVTLSTHEFSAGERIFYLKSPDLAIPLWQSKQDGSSISGKITHFSDYIGGSPNSEEAQSQAGASSGLGGDFPDGWKDSLEGNQAMSEWGNGLNELGLGDEGNAVIDQAREQLQQNLECLLNPSCTPQPDDPCGEYLLMVLMYYQQAILLGFDPESSMMQSLYNLVEEVLNKCTNRYSLVYNHKLSTNQMGVQQDMLVTGEVIFVAPVYGVGEAGRPLKMEGSGTTNVAISGTMTKDDEVCTISGEGSNAVSITGELVADEMGNPSISLEVNEQWYTSGSLTVACPDGDAQTAPLPGLPNQKFSLEFPYQDGAQITQPNVGGLSGSYMWTLNIIHSW